MRILVVGSGGREHALAWKLAQSPRAERIYVAPGNGGTAVVAENVPIEATDIPKLVAFARRERIDLTVVGPEAPLVAGLVDAFAEAGLCAFGPRAAAARLEGSKAFTKALCARHGIPTAAFRVFEASERAAARAHVAAQAMPVVVKADGLAAGKGVTVAATVDGESISIRQLSEDVGVQPPAGDAVVSLRDVQRHVGHAVGDVEKEGLVAVVRDELDGPAGGPLGQTPLIGIAGDDGGAVDQGQVGKAMGRMPRPHVVGVG